jgi:hypothetical protein
MTEKEAFVELVAAPNNYYIVLGGIYFRVPNCSTWQRNEFLLDRAQLFGGIAHMFGTVEQLKSHHPVRCC